MSQLLEHVKDTKITGLEGEEHFLDNSNKIVMIIATKKAYDR